MKAPLLDDANVELLEKNIGYHFKDKELLRTAFKHTSYANDNNEKSYERLEFLGDSILEFITSEYIYNKYNNYPEGKMTKIRSYSVCETTLYEIAIKHNFSDFLFLGNSESEENKHVAILADVIEALIAAMYIDSKSLDVSKKFILDNIKDYLDGEINSERASDYKTILQEIMQAKGQKVHYKTINSEGPDHDKTFTVEVNCNNIVLAVAKGKSKKKAEAEAAKIALENLKK